MSQQRQQRLIRDGECLQFYNVNGRLAEELHNGAENVTVNGKKRPWVAG